MFLECEIYTSNTESANAPSVSEGEIYRRGPTSPSFDAESIGGTATTFGPRSAHEGAEVPVRIAGAGVPGRVRFRTVCMQIRRPKQLDRDSSIFCFGVLPLGHKP